MREDGDYALTRPNSRTPSRIINAAAAADLLKEFRTPATIVEAVIRYSRERKVDPERTLEEAFPMLESLAVSGLLAPSSSAKAKQILPSLEVPSRFMEIDVLRCVQSLDDTELYELMGANGQYAALKLGRANATDRARRTFDREAAMLKRIAGDSSPRLLRDDTTELGQRYLLAEWCPGKDCAAVSALMRAEAGAASRSESLTLCSSILTCLRPTAREERNPLRYTSPQYSG